jgi:Carbohydrate family 9 binding domain-like
MTMRFMRTFASVTLWRTMKPGHQLSLLVGAFASVSLFVACGLSLQGTAQPSPDASTFEDGRVADPDATVLPADAAVEVSRDSAMPRPMLSEDPGKPDCTGPSASTYAATQWDQSITPDGNASDWPASVKWNKLSIQRSAFLCADFAVVWSASALHVLVRVEDKAHERTPDTKDLWRNDSTEVFFGPPPLALSGAYRVNDVQWIVDHNGRSSALVGGSAANKPMSNATYRAGAREFSAWGFVTEYTLPKALVSDASVDLAVGAMIPFSVAAGDGPGKDMDQVRYASWVMPKASIACVSQVPNVQYCCNGAGELGPFCNTLQWGVLTLQ